MLMLYWIGWVAVGLAAAPLESWRARTGWGLEMTPGVVPQPTESGLALVGRGQSLVLENAPASAPLDAVLETLWAPFVAAGIAPPVVEDASCLMVGKPALCRRARIEVAAGAHLELVAGRPDGADWVVVCMDRGTAKNGVCKDHLELAP